MSHYEKLKALKMGQASDFYTALYARSMGGSSKEYERYISGELPLILSDSVGKPLAEWSITGNTVQDGEPTPDNPVEVKGVGDKTENLFERVIKGTNISSNGVVITGESAENFDLFITKVKRNTKYTVSEKVSHTHVIGFFKDDIKNGSITYNQSRIVTTGEKSYTFTTPDADINYVAIRFASNSVNIMLNEGSEPLPYKPFGYEIDVVSRGKNLVNSTSYEAIYAYDDKTVLNAVNSLPIGTYSLSIKFKLTSRRDISDVSNYGVITIPPVISYKPSWGASDVGEVRKYTVVLTISPNNVGKFEHFYVYGCGNDKVGATGKAEVSDFQIELGDTATEYEPYIEPKTSEIYLDSPLMANEVLKSDGSREVEWRELVLTGDEPWEQDSYDGKIKVVRLDRIGAPYPVEYSKVYCTHCQSVQSYDLLKQYTLVVAVSGRPGLFFGSKNDATIDEFKSFLASEYAKGTPVTVYYLLATPTSETVDVPAIQTLKGNTVIDVDTEVQPTNMSVTYKSRR